MWGEEGETATRRKMKSTLRPESVNTVGGGGVCVWGGGLQTPSPGLRHPSLTTAMVDDATGLEKVSADEQFLQIDGAQTAASLLQRTPILSDVSLIPDHVAYAGTKKTKTV